MDPTRQEGIMELVNLLRVIHVLNAIMMAWPAYALLAVNQRGRLGPPLGDRADLYLESMIKSRVLPCYIFQLTALVSGIWLLFATGLGISALWTNWLLGLKFLLLLVLAGILSSVHFTIQPRIDALFARSSEGRIDKADAEQIRSLRITRKRLASFCMFGVLTISMLGVQALAPFPIWLTVGLIVLIAAFTWRSYKVVTPLGWV
jgi:hypothetical protein